VKRFARENALSLLFGALFLGSLIGQAIAGHAAYNDDEVAHAALLHQGAETVSLWRYVTSSDFANSVMENWQSEYLQFSLFILATIWLVQRGSTESKEPGEEGPSSDEEDEERRTAGTRSPLWARAGGLRTRLYGNSLLAVMLTIFALSWFAQSVTGWREYDDTQREHRQPSVSWTGYVTSAGFWEATLENWQSEFLAVGSMAVFTIYLRQRGSQQSKPVSAPHDETAVSN
jgi:uncharacterized protein DUF6766